MSSGDSKQSGALSDRVFAVAWLAVCVIILFQMWRLEVPFAYEPVGPKAFPMLMAVLMGLCCLVLIVKPDTNIEWPEAALLGKSSLLVAALLAYASLFAVLGFPLATAGMALVVSRLFGGGWLASAVTAVSIGLLGYLLFDRMLEVSLPLGLLRFEG